MKNLLANSLLALLFLAALTFVYLTNTGVIRFGSPFIRSIDPGLPTEQMIVAFTRVNIVPMDREIVLENQTVIIRNGRIERIAPSGEVTVPEGAFIIDGTGKYLVPGLVDMHVHIEFENDMLLFVAIGVTGVRKRWGNTGRKIAFGLPDQLALRNNINAGELFGPTIYTAGPVMEGVPAFHPLAEVFVTPEEAANSVIWQKEQGYDFVKVYDNLSVEVYTAIMEAAQAQDIPVVGHVPFAVGLDGVLESGQQTIEHLAGYIEADAAQFILPEDQLDAYAAKTVDAGVWNCVTLVEYPMSKQTPEGYERLKDQHGMAYVSPGWKFFSPFIYYMTARSHTYPGEDYAVRMAALNDRMVQALQDAGAGILLGTDAAQAYNIPGFSIHQELQALVSAGLSPFEALEAGTRNAAAAMDKLEEFGTVQEGRRADLLLLDANPLEDVGNVEKIAGVILRGRWLSASDLNGLLEGLVESYRPGFLDRLWPFSLLAAAAFWFFRKKKAV